MPTTSDQADAETGRRQPRKGPLSRTGDAGTAGVATGGTRAKLAETALTILLTLSISGTLLIAWLWALAMWYPASSPPAADPNHGCGPMAACLDT